MPGSSGVDGYLKCGRDGAGRDDREGLRVRRVTSDGRREGQRCRRNLKQRRSGGEAESILLAGGEAVVIGHLDREGVRRDGRGFAAEGAGRADAESGRRRHGGDGKAVGLGASADDNRLRVGSPGNAGGQWRCGVEYQSGRHEQHEIRRGRSFEAIEDGNADEVAVGGRRYAGYRPAGIHLQTRGQVGRGEGIRRRSSRGGELKIIVHADHRGGKRRGGGENGDARDGDRERLGCHLVIEFRVGDGKRERIRARRGRRPTDGRGRAAGDGERNSSRESAGTDSPGRGGAPIGADLGGVERTLGAVGNGGGIDGELRPGSRRERQR